MDNSWDIKHATQAQLVQHCATRKKGERGGARPNHVVNSHHTLQTGGSFALTYQGFEGRPGEAHANDVSNHHKNLTKSRMALRTQHHGQEHDEESQFEGF